MNNEPAFPISSSHGEGIREPHYGITMLDFFAAKAMQGYLASMNPGPINKGYEEDIAETSYRVSAAMLRAREEAIKSLEK